MKNKKSIKSKILVPALAVLALTTTASVTSTVAWFASNNIVSATGMQIAAKSDSVYLLISADKTTATDIQAQNKISVSAITSSSTNVYPSAWATNEAAGWKSKMTKGGDFATVGNWYKAVAESVSASTAKFGDTTTALVSFNDYVIKYDFYMTLAQGSEPAKDLKISSYSVNFPKDADPSAVKSAVKTVFVCDDAYEELASTASSGSTVLKASLDDKNVAHVIAYVYYDGNDSSVFTNNKANLSSCTMNVGFTATIA